MQGIDGYLGPTESARQFVGEQDIGQLGLLIRAPAAVLALKLKVIEVNGEYLID